VNGAYRIDSDLWMRGRVAGSIRNRIWGRLESWVKGRRRRCRLWQNQRRRVYGRFVPRADIVVGDGWRGLWRRRGVRHLRKELICHDTGRSGKTCEGADYDDISRRSAINWSISFNDVYLVCSGSSLSSYHGTYNVRRRYATASPHVATL